MPNMTNMCLCVCVSVIQSLAMAHTIQMISTSNVVYSFGLFYCHAWLPKGFLSFCLSSPRMCPWMLVPYRAAIAVPFGTTALRTSPWPVSEVVHSKALNMWSKIILCIYSIHLHQQNRKQRWRALQVVVSSTVERYDRPLNMQKFYKVYMFGAL